MHPSLTAGTLESNVRLERRVAEWCCACTGCKAGFTRAAGPALAFRPHAVRPLWEGQLAEGVQELAAIALPPVLDWQ